MARPRTWERAEVLERAVRLFQRKGYEGTHLRELVEACGINRFSLYQEFGGKEGLFRAALEAYVAGLDELGALLAAEPAGLDNVRAFFAAQVAMGFRHGCFALNTVREKLVVPARAFAAVETFARGIRAGMRRNVEGAVARGELAADTDVEALTGFLSAFDMGFLSFGILNPDDDLRARVVAELDRVLR